MFANSLACLLLVGLGSDQPSTGPGASSWASWTKGSWVLCDVDNSVSGSMTIKQTLLAIENETYRTRDETHWEGGSTTTDAQIHWASFGYPHALPDAKRVATELVTVQGKEYECDVYRAHYSEEGVDWDVISWIHPKLDQPLKIRIKGKLEISLDVTRTEDFVPLGQRKFRCVRYAGTVMSNGTRSTIDQWRSSAVPGALVRSVTTTEKQGTKIVHTMQVREFRGTRLD